MLEHCLIHLLTLSILRSFKQTSRYLTNDPPGIQLLLRQFLEQLYGLSTLVLAHQLVGLANLSQQPDQVLLIKRMR